jgi:cysteinyl-tRNA synthetase
LFEFSNSTNKFFEQKPEGNLVLCTEALALFLKIGNVLSLFQPKTTTPKKQDEEKLIQALQHILDSFHKKITTPQIDELLHHIIQLREDARKQKDWKTADVIRKQLADVGIELQDTANGPVWRKK